MKKIITAIGNSFINDNLKKTGIFNIICKDIQYKEGVLEILDEYKDIDILIISEILEGDIKFETLIEKIKKQKSDLEIIVFMDEENEELQKFLYGKEIYKCFFNNQLDMNNLIKILNGESIKNTEELNEEIRKLKQIIKEQQQNNEFKKEKGIISVVTGASGSGKSTITCIICKEFVKQKKKTLIIDFDAYNKSISILYNKFCKKIDFVNIKNNIIEISKYEYLLSMEKEFFDNYRLIDIIKSLKYEYEEILIDTSSYYKSNYYGQILEIADEIIFLINPTMCDLKKGLNIYEILTMDFKISKQKIKLIINKDNDYSIDSLLIKEMFGVKKITGKVQYEKTIENIISGKIKKNLKINI